MAELAPVVALPAVVVVVEVVEAGSGFKSESPELGKIDLMRKMWPNRQEWDCSL